ncbi:hypothetical protein [Lichenicoccus sp.]|uniref:hypothetical protein n=1 Tax=Lichenicoccus sp. TaxID=2781899 RepID=UPI003D12CD07
MTKDEEAVAELEQQRKRVREMSDKEFRAAVSVLDQRRLPEPNWEAIRGLMNGRKATELTAGEWGEVQKLFKTGYV